MTGIFIQSRNRRCRNIISKAASLGFAVMPSTAALRMLIGSSHLNLRIDAVDGTQAVSRRMCDRSRAIARVSSRARSGSGRW